MSNMIISAADVRFVVGGKTLLDIDRLNLPASGVTALVGQNGSGKSTLLRILARQLTPTTGRVTFAGRALHAWRDRELARQIGYLPQHTPLASGLRSRELVSLGRYPWHGPLGRFTSEDARKVDEALAITGVEALSDREVDSLSGGERQRVWLAMLLAQDPRLLLLDEPISALDPAHQVSVLALIQRICLEKDVAVVAVLHDINLASRFGEQLIALKSGRLISQGAPSEFMSSARLSEVYDVDMGVFPNPDSDGMIAFVRVRPDA